ALGAGIKPLIGADILLDEGPKAPASLLTLLVQNRDGYRNLCELLTLAYLHGQDRGQVLCRREWVTAKSAGLIALSGGMYGDVGLALTAGKTERAQQLAAQWLALFGDRYYLEVTRAGRNG